MFKRIMVILAIFAFAVMSGCTRIESGHSGVRVNFNGSYDPQELGVGFHQHVVGTIKKYVTNEMTISLNDLRPQTKDKTLMQDLDLTFTSVSYTHLTLPTILRV